MSIGTHPIGAERNCPVCTAEYAIWPLDHVMVCHCQQHPWFPLPEDRQRLVELIRNDAFWGGAPSNEAAARQIADAFFGTARTGDHHDA